MKGRTPAKILSAALAGTLITTVAATPATAAEVITPYPSVAAEPGQTSTFDLQIMSDESETVNVEVTEAPEGWTTVLRGDGRQVSAVHTSPSEAGEVQLDVSVPDDAEAGRHRVVVRASGAASGTSTLPLTLEIVEQAPQAFELSAEYPSLQGDASETFNFNLTLENRSSQDATFSIAAGGPQGWTVNARPAAQQQAASFTVPAGDSSSITVEAQPPEGVAAGTYELGVQASGESGGPLQQVLNVEIIGSTSMTLSTANERLSMSGNAGEASTVTLVITNDGNTPLEGVELSSTPPTDWEVEFEPSSVDVPAGQSTQVNARITPAGNAVAGDYSVTLSAAGGGNNESVDIRYAVETSGWWGFVGVLLILAALAALFGVYRRYGRR
ncbi:MAG TPA: NEW3 domain-containing protein [Jiangellaceae bacterium]